MQEAPAQEPRNPSFGESGFYESASDAAFNRMATATEPKTALTFPPNDVVNSPSKASEPVKIDVTRLPTDDNDLEDIDPTTTHSSRTTLHIYFEHPCSHKHISPVLSPSQERRFGPTPKQKKERRITKNAERKLRDVSETAPSLTATPLSPESAQADNKGEESYFLHTPYLSFHLPPSVLYICNPSSPHTPSRYPPNRPVALVHTGCFWRTYTIQLGPSLATPGVIDPRGVVSWSHNDAGSARQSEKDGKSSGTALKGYKVRPWRLWGESGKKYTHWVREMRKTGVQFADPDVDAGSTDAREKVRADEVVQLIWTAPLSRHARLYTFVFRGVVFQWKGTGTVSEARKCGWMLRFCHLKLVAKISAGTLEKKETREVCLGKYTSSIAAEKSGTLEVFDGVVLGFVEECMPSLLEGKSDGGEKGDDDGKIARLKQGMLYQLFVATALCMANAEKEKRHTLIDLIIGIAENGGNGGG